MTTKPFAFFTVPGDSPQATKPVADHILKLEAEVAHLRSLLAPGLNVIDARMAALRAELKAAREDAMHVKTDRDNLRSMVTLGVSPTYAGAVEQRAREAEAENNLLRAQLAKAVRERDAARTIDQKMAELRAERNLLRAQLTKVVQERDEARAQLTSLQQSAAKAATLSRTIAEGLDAQVKARS